MHAYASSQPRHRAVLSRLTRGVGHSATPSWHVINSQTISRWEITFGLSCFDKLKIFLLKEPPPYTRSTTIAPGSARSLGVGSARLLDVGLARSLPAGSAMTTAVCCCGQLGCPSNRFLVDEISTLLCSPIYHYQYPSFVARTKVRMVAAAGAAAGGSSRGRGSSSWGRGSNSSSSISSSSKAAAAAATEASFADL